jgi:hypothetical protein
VKFPPNVAPVFVPEPKDIKVEVSKGDSYIYNLPNIQDLNGDKVTVDLEASDSDVILKD